MQFIKKKSTVFPTQKHLDIIKKKIV